MTYTRGPKYVRKNVMVDARKLHLLADRLGTSESEAVRQAVEALLLEAEVLDAAQRIRARGTLADVRGKRPGRRQ